MDPSNPKFLNVRKIDFEDDFEDLDLGGRPRAYSSIVEDPSHRKSYVLKAPKLMPIRAQLDPPPLELPGPYKVSKKRLNPVKEEEKEFDFVRDDLACKPNSVPFDFKYESHGVKNGGMIGSLMDNDHAHLNMEELLSDDESPDMDSHDEGAEIEADDHGIINLKDFEGDNTWNESKNTLSTNASSSGSERRCSVQAGSPSILKFMEDSKRRKASCM